MLSGISSSYMQLPAGILGNNPASVSVEFWCTIASSGNSIGWVRLLQFGAYSLTNTGSFSFGRSDTDNGFRFESWNAQSSKVATSGSSITTAFNGRNDLHVVLILTNGGSAQNGVYLNGALAASITGSFYMPTGSTGELNYVGFGTDTSQPALVGSFNEFRVWSGALLPSQISNNYVAWPFTST